MPYDNTNRGMLSRNDRKEKAEHPDFRGQCDIEGVQFWVDAWIKVAGENSKTPGRKFFSLSFKPKEQAAPAKAPAKSTGFDDMDDDIPF